MQGKDPRAGGTGYLENVEKLYDAMTKSTEDYVYISDMRSGTFRYSKSMVEEFELPGEVVENAAQVLGKLVHPHDREVFLQANREIAEGLTDKHCVEYRVKNRRGEWMWMRCRGHVEYDEQGKPCMFAGMITNLGKKNKIDHITGLFNKFEFESAVCRLIEETSTETLGILLLGLDGFAHVNDLYDRVFGDEVIRITGQKLQSLSPSDAAVYRMDGDEFAVLFRNSTKEEMEKFYRQIQMEFARQQIYEGKKYFCTVSGGGVLFPHDGVTYLELVKYADYSLEFAKKSGKNQIMFFSREIMQHKARELDMVEQLRESAENGFSGFELYYQPLIDAKSGKVMGAEALARWNSRVLGPVSPLEFIPLLEESGLIYSVGQWILEEAVKTCRQWVSKCPDFIMNVNISCLQFEHAGFMESVEEILDRLGGRPDHMALELTESYIASNYENLSALFYDLRQKGFRIAMDDFGTGYSSLGLLKHSPADMVKVDKTFVDDVLESEFDATFIRFIVELCHTTGIQVCLEGVETGEQLKALDGMKLDCFQGFYFGRPVNAKEFEEKFLCNHLP